MTGSGSGRRALPWLMLATLSGAVHALFSAIWAAGSGLLLSTVGQVAREISALGPSRRALLLGVIAAAKAGVTAVPLVDAALRSSDGVFRALVRGGELVAGVCLAVYGVVSMAASAVGLIGAMSGAQQSPADLTALWGHLGIWDLLFALWGVGILGYLRTTSTTRTMNKEAASC